MPNWMQRNTWVLHSELWSTLSAVIEISSSKNNNIMGITCDRVENKSETERAKEIARKKSFNCDICIYGTFICLYAMMKVREWVCALRCSTISAAARNRHRHDRRHTSVIVLFGHTGLFVCLDGYCGKWIIVCRCVGNSLQSHRRRIYLFSQPKRDSDETKCKISKKKQWSEHVTVSLCVDFVYAQSHSHIFNRDLSE